MEDSEEMIVVEGRADIINLLKHGIRNTLAIEGASVPDPVKQISKEKVTTAFMDGDRGGLLNLKGLMETADIDFVALAPEGKEVEELSKKEIYKALREKVPAGQFKFDRGGRSKRPAAIRGKKPERRTSSRETRERKSPGSIFKKQPRLKKEEKERFAKILSDLVGSRAACIYDSKEQLLGKVPVTELLNTLRTIDNPYAIVFDGKADQKLARTAADKGTKYLVAMEKEETSARVAIFEKKDLK
jgi:DNA primase